MCGKVIAKRGLLMFLFWITIIALSACGGGSSGSTELGDPDIDLYIPDIDLYINDIRTDTINEEGTVSYMLNLSSYSTYTVCVYNITGYVSKIASYLDGDLLEENSEIVGIDTFESSAAVQIKVTGSSSASYDIVVKEVGDNFSSSYALPLEIGEPTMIYDKHVGGRYYYEFDVITGYSYTIRWDDILGWDVFEKNGTDAPFNLFHEDYSALDDPIFSIPYSTASTSGSYNFTADTSEKVTLEINLDTNGIVYLRID